MSPVRILVAVLLVSAATVSFADSPKPATGDVARQVWLNPSQAAGSRPIPANSETDALEGRLEANFERMKRAKEDGDREVFMEAQQKMQADFARLKAMRQSIQAEQAAKTPAAPLMRLLPQAPRGGISPPPSAGR